MAADGAHDRQAIASVQPAIGGDHVRQGRKVRPVGKGSTRVTIATPEPLMGSLIVVVLRKLRQTTTFLPGVSPSFPGSVYAVEKHLRLRCEYLIHLLSTGLKYAPLLLDDNSSFHEGME